MKVSTGPGVEVEFEYTFTLLDPCESPQMTVTPAVYADQDYTIIDFADTYTPGTLFSVTPSYCQTESTVSAPGLNEDDSVENGADDILAYDEATQ